MHANWLGEEPCIGIIGPNQGPHGSAIIEIGYLNDDGNLESNCYWILRIVYTVI